MRYIGKEIGIIDRKNIVSSHCDNEKYIEEAIIELFSRIRVLLYEKLSDYEIHIIKCICEEIEYTEQCAMERLVNNTPKETSSISNYLGLFKGDGG